MTIEQVVTDRLESLSAVTAIVGTRIYQLKLRQNTAFPAVRVQLISDTKTYHLRGTDGIARARVQVDSYNSETGSDPYGRVAALAEAIEEGMSGIRFDLGGFRVIGAIQVLRLSSHEANGPQPLIRMQQDFRFVYERNG